MWRYVPSGYYYEMWLEGQLVHIRYSDHKLNHPFGVRGNNFSADADVREHKIYRKEKQ